MGMSTASDLLTREQLEADHVSDGVAKWGEDERDGLIRQAKAKSLDTLRVDYDLRHGDEETAMAGAAYRARNQSVVYPEFGLGGNS